MKRKTKQMNEKEKFKRRYMKVKSFIKTAVSKGVEKGYDDRKAMFEFIDMNFPDILSEHPESIVARANSDLKHFYEQMIQKKDLSNLLNDPNLCFSKYLEFVGEEIDFYSRCQSCNGYGIYVPASPESDTRKKDLEIELCPSFKRVRDVCKEFSKIRK